ncbi:hypothetical protein FIBSPDRAFT_59869 [Athelia psychrophila]|uniref:Uncharacterized protein n=1 Tax=Athelia psychrophila TaxID=1759441 RepID=A0A166F4I4_9AGAM|nr:hypothetical protein FIBSPDRAFT_59869 [Fibularhizoctonia sp. CBS 109695]
MDLDTNAHYFGLSCLFERCRPGRRKDINHPCIESRTCPLTQKLSSLPPTGTCTCVPPTSANSNASFGPSVSQRLWVRMAVHGPVLPPAVLYHLPSRPAGVSASDTPRPRPRSRSALRIPVLVTHGQEARKQRHRDLVTALASFTSSVPYGHSRAGVFLSPEAKSGWMVEATHDTLRFSECWAAGSREGGWRAWMR